MLAPLRRRRATGCGRREQVLSLAVEGPRVEDIAAAKAQLQADEATLALAQHRLRDTRLYAPEAGTVLTRILEPGAAVLPNTPAYTLAIDNPVWVRTYVSETDLGRVFPNMQAEITTDSFPGRIYHGWVGFISPTAEFTPKPVEAPDLRSALVYRLRVYVKNPDRTLRQGMPVTVALQLAQPPASGQAPGVPPVLSERAVLSESAGDTAVEVDGVTKTFPAGAARVSALRALSVRIRRGCITGLVGPDGSGKTTLLRLIGGLLTPDAGRILVLGLDAVEQSELIRSDSATCRSASACTRI